ncbi:hypothetical protein AVEN_170412-1 [Araneus ventricosus]|uniref:Uncharacterized protein n=1 Tax=Araneus ventricosus TaxID=182803 RepID=A0A4Y2VLD4_ARAVE|nr:hypothetical protein AVEN_246908-1 [Araneus ventricosus]GBO25982.1 hypothetical protein AVEN_170412-1 [Araneus ventricosus]
MTSLITVSHLALFSFQLIHWVVLNSSLLIRHFTLAPGGHHFSGWLSQPASFYINKRESVKLLALLCMCQTIENTRENDTTQLNRKSVSGDPASSLLKSALPSHSQHTDGVHKQKF